MSSYYSSRSGCFCTITNSHTIIARYCFSANSYCLTSRVCSIYFIWIPIIYLCFISNSHCPLSIIIIRSLLSDNYTITTLYICLIPNSNRI